MHEMTVDHVANPAPKFERSRLLTRLEQIGIGKLMSLDRIFDSSDEMIDRLAAALILERALIGHPIRFAIEHGRTTIRRWIHDVLSDIDDNGRCPRVLTGTQNRTLIIHSACGKGGFGQVLRSTATGTDQHLAVKFIHPLPADDALSSHLRERFENEAGLLRQIDLDGVPTFFDSLDANGCPCIVMELIEGVSLKQLLSIVSTADLPLQLILRSALLIAELLGVLHAQGIAHSDIKPDNILLGRSRLHPKLLRPWIVDFGLARRLNNQSTRLTVDGQTVGTFGYMDPQTIGQADRRGPESDMFSLGATLYELYAKTPLFTEDELQQPDHQLNTVIEAKRCAFENRADRSPLFEDLILSMLSCAQEKRPSAEAVMSNLIRIIHGQSMTPSRYRGLAAQARLLSVERLDQWDDLDAAVRIRLLQESPIAPASRLRPKTVTGILAAIGASVAIVLGTLSRDEPQAIEAQPINREALAQEKPLAPIIESRNVQTMTITAVIDRDDRLMIGSQSKILLSRPLNTLPALTCSGLSKDQRAFAITIEADELFPLLEHARTDSTLQLIKRSYPCYLLVKDGQNDQSRVMLLSTPRGCLYWGRTSGFWRREELDHPSAEEVRGFLKSWNGAVLDGISAPPERIVDMAEGKQQLKAANAMIKLLCRQAGLR